MAKSDPAERLYNDFVRNTKRLWEHANSTNWMLEASGPHAQSIEFLNVPSKTSKRFGANAVRDSARNMRQTLLWEWCLIIGIARFDAWIEDTVRCFHEKFPHLKGQACLKGFRDKTPSFNMSFFAEDQGALGLEFPRDNEKLNLFISWKEARNSVMHKGGRATKRCADYGRFTTGQKIRLNENDALNMLAGLLDFAKEIHKQILELRKRVGWTTTSSPSAPSPSKRRRRA